MSSSQTDEPTPSEQQIHSDEPTPSSEPTRFDEPTPRKPLRLWPGVTAAVLLCVLRYLLPIVIPGAFLFALISGMAGALMIALWWLLFSRALWYERLGALVLAVVALLATSRIVDKSIATGAQGMLLPILAIPVLGVALAVGAAVGRRLADGPRRATIGAAILIACGLFTVLRTDGITGEGGSQFAFRWAATPEERLLGEADDEPMAPPSVPATSDASKQPVATLAVGQPAEQPSGSSAANTSKQPATSPATQGAATTTGNDWPGFRGPGRDGIIRGIQISTDWDHSPPVQLWRRPIGPGWSSFAVSGDLCYTQEQRGNEEVVACYNRTTGKPVWRHRDPVRFWESNGGAGPRATPTLSGNRVYAFGATGILNALDAATGAVAWSRNVASDSETKVPGWGFASSPLVTGDLVIVAASGKLVGYDRATGKPRWFGPVHGGSYSSPHRVTIDGVPQVLLLSEAGATSVSPTSGAVLWEHAWPGGAIVQPAITTDGDVLINSIAPTGGVGTRRLAIANGPGGWTVQERWTSNGLKPYFNDFVVHKGHAYGFDGSILACIDLNDGQRKWKGGRYGNGQLVLLADQDLLLVLSEEGELALVGATPNGFKEFARFKAIEGKTWNHPALVGDVLLIRNGQEMAAFRLPLAGR
jgi:outer membrane protein assembly factor BamB